MIHAQNTKKVMLFHGSYTNAATASASADTRGWDYASIDITLDSVAAATNNLSVCLVAESDDTTTTVTNISGTVGDTDWTIPNNNTQSAQIIAFDVDLRPRKRYLTLKCSPVTTQILSAVMTLSRGDESPSTTTEGGVIARTQV